MSSGWRSLFRMHLEGEDPVVRKRWGRDGMIFGSLGMLTTAIIMVLFQGLPWWSILIVALVALPIGHVMGVAYYNRTLFMRRLLGKGPPK